MAPLPARLRQRREPPAQGKRTSPETGPPEATGSILAGSCGRQMKLPRFTAEASLYKSRGTYGTFGGRLDHTRGLVRPAQPDITGEQNITGEPAVLVDLGLESNQALGLYRCRYFSKLHETCSRDCLFQCRRYFMTGKAQGTLCFDPVEHYVDLPDCLGECDSCCERISTVCYPRLKTGHHVPYLQRAPSGSRLRCCSP
jgi:hypothetical protein